MEEATETHDKFSFPLEEEEPEVEAKEVEVA